MISDLTNFQRWLRIGFGLALFLLAVRFILFSVEMVGRPTHGFVAAYAASRLLIEGEDMAQLYDDAWFIAQVNRFEPTIGDIYINPPTTALLLLPLAWLPYAPARAVWITLNIIALAIMVFWLARQLRFTGLWLYATFIAVLLFQPVYSNIYLGQVYLFLLGLLLLAWHGYRQEKDSLSGIMLSLMLIFKLAGLFLWPLFLVRKRWRAIAWGVGITTAVILFTWPWMGTAAWQRHVITALESGGKPERLVTAHQSWTSFSGHFFIMDEQWNPAPLFDQAAVGAWLNGLGAVALLAVSLFVVYRAARSPAFRELPHFSGDLSFAIFVILSVILSPLALDYHYPLLLLPLAIAAAYVRAQGAEVVPESGLSGSAAPRWIGGTAVYWLILLFAFFLMAADLPYRSPRLADGAWALLAYPKLYGALLLWGFSTWLLWRKQKQETPA